MRYDLATMARRNNVRRKAIPIRTPATPGMFATDLYAIYNRIIRAWEAGKPAIMASYERALAGMVTDSPADVEQEVSSIAATLERLTLILTPQLTDWALNVERWQRGKWRGAVLSATGVDLGTLIGVGDVRATLETTIGWNTALVRDVSKQVESRIASAVFDGLRNRSPARDVAKQITNATGLGRKRARLIAADQLSKISESLADERRREAGLDVWEWKHSGKLNYRPDHKTRDGKLYGDNADSVGKVVNGKTVATPPKDRPGQLIRCGCRSLSVLVLD